MAVPVQVVAESRAVATAVPVAKAVDSAEAIGVVVLDPSVAEATVKALLLTTLRRIEEDAAEKNYYIDSSSMPCSKMGLPHLAAVGTMRTLC